MNRFCMEHPGTDETMNGCGNGLPMNAPVAMAYVPWQKFTNTYEPQKALMAGTIFPELDLPFLGRRPGGMSR